LSNPIFKKSSSLIGGKIILLLELREELIESFLISMPDLAVASPGLLEGDAELMNRLF
jgi:hypothetical protein